MINKNYKQAIAKKQKTSSWRHSFTSGNINKAIEFAAKAHMYKPTKPGKEFRKGTDTPYFTHPFAVGIILARYGCHEELIIAGLLHDCLEDTRITAGEIKSIFGDIVVNIVKGCSEPDKEDTWENRKKHTIRYLKNAPLDVRIVSCADKLHNLRCTISDYKINGELLWKRFKRGKQEQIWYYTALSKIFSKGVNRHPIFSEFNRAVIEFSKSLGVGNKTRRIHKD